MPSTICKHIKGMTVNVIEKDSATHKFSITISWLSDTRRLHSTPRNSPFSFLCIHSLQHILVSKRKTKILKKNVWNKQKNALVEYSFVSVLMFIRYRCRIFLFIFHQQADFTTFYVLFVCVMSCVSLPFYFTPSLFERTITFFFSSLINYWIIAIVSTFERQTFSYVIQSITRHRQETR